MTNEIKIGDNVKVRILSYKSYRHYGGREISVKQNICNAKFIRLQPGHQPYIVELLEDCAGFPNGHKIAITENNFNL